MGDLERQRRHEHQRASATTQSIPTPGKANRVTETAGQATRWNATPYKRSIFSAAALPWPPSEGAGLRTLERFVDSTEAKVRTLTPQRLKSALAPDAVIATITAELAEDFERLEAKLAGATVAATETTTLLQRLDVVMARLFTLARDHRVRMRDSGLERAFDGEDKLRLDFSYHGGRANRAELYYDDNLAPPERRHGSTNAHDVADTMRGANTSLTAPMTPQTRDDLIRHIESLGTALAEWIELGFEEAKQTIDEPSAPRDPELLKQLAEAAGALILGHANTALAASLGAIAKSVDKQLGASAVGRYATKQVGAKMTRTLLRGFITGGGTAVKTVAGAATSHASTPTAATRMPRERENEGLSPKSIYLRAARRNTVEKAVGIQVEFSKYVGELKRLPVETLATIADCVGAKQRQEVSRAFSRLIVREWVTFGKHAMEHGEEVRDETHRQAHPSKLDNFLAPYGVVRIHMTLHPRSTVTFDSADLPGVSDAVLDSIKREGRTLGELSLHRRVAVRAGGADRLQLGTFDLDPQGNIIEVGRMNIDGRRAFARLANPMFAKDGFASTFSLEPSEADVLAGTRVIAKRLVAVTCDTIKAVKVDGR